MARLMRWLLVAVVIVVAYVLVRKFLTSPTLSVLGPPPDWVGNKPVPIAVTKVQAVQTQTASEKALAPLSATTVGIVGGSSAGAPAASAKSLLQKAGYN